MASLVTCAATGLTWCFCQACGSLLGSCFGNDKPSTVPPSVASGRKRSVFIIILSIAFALAFQYGIGPAIIDHQGISNPVTSAWTDGCRYSTNSDSLDIDLQKRCAGNNGVYRVSGATFIFFILATIAVLCKPTANREAWPAKIVLYLFMVGITVVMPNEPVFSNIFLNIARAGAIIFIILQQFVILDLAFNWNDSWVNKSNEAEREQVGSGKKWLVAIVLACACLFTFCVTTIIVMFARFTGCTANNGFIAGTLVLCILVTVTQLSGEEGSLLSSACICAWASFLCYSAVSKNPNSECNPGFGKNDKTSIVIGMAVTVLSMAWAGWSFTAEDKLRIRGEDDDEAAGDSKQQPLQPPAEKGKVTGVVVSGSANNGTDEEAQQTGQATENDKEEGDDAAASDPRKLSNSWRLNVGLGVLACWQAMLLTSWGQISAQGNLSNPSAGRIGMWMIVTAEWLALALYLWALMAPRLFPNRDFS